MFKKIKKPTPQLLEEIEEVKEKWIREAVYFAKNDFPKKCEAYSHYPPFTSHDKDIIIEDVVSRAIAINRPSVYREILGLVAKYDEKIEMAEILKEWDVKAEKQIKHILETIKGEF